MEYRIGKYISWVSINPSEKGKKKMGGEIGWHISSIDI